MPLKRPFFAMEEVQLFLYNVVKFPEFPKMVVKDTDPVFCGPFCIVFFFFFKFLRMKLLYSFAFFPHTDVQPEVLNRCWA